MYFSFRDNDMNNQCSINNYSQSQTPMYNPNTFSQQSSSPFGRQQPSFGQSPFDQPQHQSFGQSQQFSPSSFGQPSAFNEQSGSSYESLQNNDQYNAADFFRSNLQQADVYNNMFLGQNQNQQQHHSQQQPTSDNILQNNVLRITRELGAGPSTMDNSPDGSASWKYSAMIKGGSVWCRVFNKIELCAEKKHIRTPQPHSGCVTTTTKVKLDCDLVRSLQKELQQISYCPATKNLRITSDSLEHCVGILALVCSCQQRKVSVGKIKYYNLANKYFRLTTPGDKKYCPSAKYALIKFIQS